MEIPQFIDFVNAENAAAGMSRGLTERTDNWGQLVAIAQRILAAVQDEHLRAGQAYKASRLLDQHYGAAVVAAARILDSASRSEGVDDSHRQRLALCAAAAFSMAGNFPSAHAVAQFAIDKLKVEISPLTWLALGCFSPRLLSFGRLQTAALEDRLPSDAIELVQGFLESGEHDLLSRVDKLILQAFLACQNNLESILLGYARVSLKFLELLSLKRVSNSFSTLIDRQTVQRLLDAQIFTFLPTQYEVLQNSPLLSSEQNALICLPTSTGKTLVGELVLAASLNNQPGLSVYIAPYIAIGLQAARALKEHLPDKYRVHTLLGDLKSDVPIDPLSHCEIVVTTPEKFDAVLRRQNVYSHLRAVLVDEAHVVSDGIRGVRLEALLTRLRMQQAAGSYFRIVCLSAVIASPERFCEWLAVPQELSLSYTWRPTARRVAIWRNNNRLTWLYAGDELRPPNARATTIFGSRALAWPAPMYPASHIAQTKAQQGALFANTAFLCRQMYAEYEEPVLCVCASRSSSRGVANRLADDLEPFETIPTELAGAIDFIDNRAPHLASLRRCLLRGVAYHNAGLPISVRQLIEKAVEKRELKVVCATTTLAEGVDLPFRITVLAEWLQWRLDKRDQQVPFGPLKFRNIVGRSGRAGVFTEGDTVVFENVLGPAKFVDPQSRTAAILSMMERPEGVRSALEEEVNPSESEARRRVISSNFLASIAERPDDEHLDETFERHLLADVRLLGGSQTTSLLKKIRTEVLSGGELAFATAASPLKLTPLGKAANHSLFSPESCRRIIQLMQAPAPNYEFENVCSTILGTLADLPEQSNADWQKAAMTPKSSRFVVKPDALPQVIAAWRRYESLPEIFRNLPTVNRSKSKDNVAEWLNGSIYSENWSNQFDKFSDFIDAVLEKFLPMVLETCVSFSLVLPNHDKGIRWRDFYEMVAQTIEARQVSAVPLPDATPPVTGLLRF